MPRRLLAALVLLVGLGLPGIAAAQSSQLAIRLTPARAFMGDVIALEADVDHAEGAKVTVPRGLKLAPFEVLRRRTRRAELPDGRVRTTVRVELITFAMGEHVVPPIELRLVEAAGRVRTLRTDPGRVVIVGRLDGVEEAEPKPNHGPAQVFEPRMWPVWVGLGVFAAILLAVIVAWLVRRHARLHPPVVVLPPPRPAWEIALEKLGAIRTEGLIAQGLTKEHYDAVSDVVREYLGALGGYPGLDLTTEEILAEVRRAPPMGVTAGELAGFFGECDLVKFAKASATAEQATALIDLAVGIVQRTRAAFAPATSAPPPPPAPATPQGPPPAEVHT